MLKDILIHPKGTSQVQSFNQHLQQDHSYPEANPQMGNKSKPPGKSSPQCLRMEELLFKTTKLSYVNQMLQLGVKKKIWQQIKQAMFLVVISTRAIHTKSRSVPSTSTEKALLVLLHKSSPLRHLLLHQISMQEISQVRLSPSAGINLTTMALQSSIIKSNGTKQERNSVSWPIPQTRRPLTLPPI